MKVKRGQEVTMTIKRLGIDGEGIGYYIVHFYCRIHRAICNVTASSKFWGS
ncbi:hypothetical protein J2S00_002853 [Caldalkalibacillus uzonensis]|uniref:TRAM domain-containing protein n=1 Tax=Caldalkalibacillus uzonensis TaxID=353224 RepID=A0ABU0CUG2_9BACI|nr:hypothetical protein [Caldalkalibacillus uzonensis]